MKGVRVCMWISVIYFWWGEIVVVQAYSANNLEEYHLNFSVSISYYHIFSHHSHWNGGFSKNVCCFFLYQALSHSFSVPFLKCYYSIPLVSSCFQFFILEYSMSCSHSLCIHLQFSHNIHILWEQERTLRSLTCQRVFLTLLYHIYFQMLSGQEYRTIKCLQRSSIYQQVSQF